MKNIKLFAKEIQAQYNVKDKVKKTKITCSDAVSKFIREVYPVDITHREAFMCVYMNRNNETIGFTVIGIGGATGTVADPKMIFQHGLICNACGIIMIHNHPSGNLKPSESDKRLTAQVVKGGKLLDMPILDHVIITENDFFSFADNGLI